MLPISDRQGPFARLLPNHKLKPIIRRVDRDERNAPIVVLPQSHRALPLTEVEHCLSVVAQNVDLAQLLAYIFLCQSSGLEGLSSRAHALYERAATSR